MVPTISVIFSIIGMVLVKLWLKKYENQLILDPKFPNKNKKKRTNFSEPYLGNRRLFCNAVRGVETAMKNAFI